MQSTPPFLAIVFSVVAALFGIAFYGNWSATGGFGLIEREIDQLPQGRAEVGYQLADAHCSGCHEIGTGGKSPIPAAPTFGDLAKRWPSVEYLAEALAEGIAVRHGEDIQMPEFVFEPTEIDDFLAYLESLR